MAYFEQPIPPECMYRDLKCIYRGSLFANITVLVIREVEEDMED